MKYTATISFELIAENDAQAYRRINRMINRTDKKHDNRPCFISLEERPFGSLITREINIDDVKALLKAENSKKFFELNEEGI